jgi:hypothetical protein
MQVTVWGCPTAALTVGGVHMSWRSLAVGAGRTLVALSAAVYVVTPGAQPNEHETVTATDTPPELPGVTVDVGRRSMV